MNEQAPRGRFALIRAAMRGSMARYAGAVLAMAGAALTSFAAPLVLAETLDAVIGGKRPLNLPSFLLTRVEGLGGRQFLLSNLWVMALALVTVNVLGGLFQYLRGRFTAQASEQIAKSLRDNLYNHLQRLSFEDLSHVNTGEMIQKCTSDVETIRRFLSTQLVEIFRTVLMVVIAATVMLKLNPTLALWSMVLVPVLFLSSLVFFRWVRRFFTDVDQAEGRLSQVLQENLAGVRVVRAFGRQQYEVEKFARANDRLLSAGRKLTDLMAVFWPAGDLISMLQTAITLAVSVYMAANGRVLVGEMTVFVSYVSMLLWPIRQLGRILSDLGKAIVSADRVEGLLRLNEEDKEGENQKPDLKGDVRFEDVRFAYPDCPPLLKGVSFTAKAGQTVAILGSTGSGKSTLVSLLQRLYEPSGGRITIGKSDLKRVDKDYLRRRVKLILQEPFLYSRTIEENIAMGADHPEKERIEQAASTACAKAFIAGFEGGYDTLVGERGVTLSGGQKQRLAIARALVEEADVLIFDDSLSAVDTQTDAAIRKALEARAEKPTTFIISHRLTTLAEADLIVVLEDGRVAQQGTHASLIAQDGLYRDVYRIQAALEAEMWEGES